MQLAWSGLAWPGLAWLGLAKPGVTGKRATASNMNGFETHVVCVCARSEHLLDAHSHRLADHALVQGRGDLLSQLLLPAAAGPETVMRQKARTSTCSAKSLTDTCLGAKVLLDA